VAQSLVYQRRFDTALQELQSIPRADRDSQVLYALGRVHLLRGEREAAREYLLAALEQDPTRYDILRALLQLDVADGRLDESSERIENALRARPDDPRFTQLQGEVALYSGRTVEAESSFRRAIELDPNDLRAYQNLARYLAVSGRPSEVLDTYERALQNNASNATLHLIVGSLYELNGRLEDATARYEEAVRLEPELAVAKNNLAYLLAERGGNLDRALDLAQEAKARLPNSAYVADTLGWVLYKKNVPSAAIGYLREAEGAIPPEDPQIGIVRHHLALAYEANGEPERAREVLNRAIRELNAQFGGEGEDRPPEPPWAAQLRSMHARLNTSS
jgi:tetratricopeptide (TPR) repeat protein